jgi:Tat protein secretion system quality control protein TatD with DNase activity
MYSGRYNDKQYHPADLDAVLARAWAAGLEKIIITAGNLEESKAALELARSDGMGFPWSALGGYRPGNNFWRRNALELCLI